jgi:hypothetical protein
MAKEETMRIESALPSGTKNLTAWLSAYKHERRELLQNDSEFARWLEDEYVPLAGGWQY